MGMRWECFLKTRFLGSVFKAKGVGKTVEFDSWRERLKKIPSFVVLAFRFLAHTFKRRYSTPWGARSKKREVLSHECKISTAIGIPFVIGSRETEFGG